MRTIYAISALSSFLIIAPLFGQTVFESTPVGASIVSVSAGNSPVAPAYVHTDTARVAIADLSVVGNAVTLSFSNVDFIQNELAPARYARYYLEVIKEGDYAGMYFDIQANGSNGITVQTWIGGEQPFEVGDVVVVRKHMTLGDFLEDATRSLSPYADSVKFYEDNNVTHSLLWDGMKWTRDFANDDSDWPIYPGQGFVCLFAQAIQFVVTGQVKTTPTKIPVYSGSNNFVGTMTPVETSFGELGVSTWMMPYADSFKLLSADGSLSSGATFFYDGLKVTPDFVTDAGDTALPAHRAFLLLPATDMNWPQPPAYSAD